MAGLVMGRLGGKRTFELYGADHFKRMNEISLQVKRKNIAKKKHKKDIKKEKMKIGLKKFNDDYQTFLKERRAKKRKQVLDKINSI
jgi:Skp family chaperone for outer membrane proteins